jgi:hypothetical protein
LCFVRYASQDLVNGLVTVPAELSRELRRGLRSLLGDAAAAMLQTSELSASAQHRESYAQPRALLAEACALLDQVGWEDPQAPYAVQVDLRRHHRALGGALRAALLVAEDEAAEARALCSLDEGPGDLVWDRAYEVAAEAHLRELREYIAAIDELSARL